MMNPSGTSYAKPKQPERRGTRLSSFRKYGAIAAGAALAVFGASRKNLAGTALAAAGGYLVFQGFRNVSDMRQSVHVTGTVTIKLPIDELYRFWRDFKNLPRFMQHLRSVTITGDRTSHWQSRAVMGATLSWDAEITDERENNFLVWRSLPGSSVDHRGSVEFRTAPANRGTQIALAMDIRPPAGKLGTGLAALFGNYPERVIMGDLRRLKQLLETGEIATTEGQSSGRRSAFIRMMQAAQTAQIPKEHRTAS